MAKVQFANTPDNHPLILSYQRERKIAVTPQRIDQMLLVFFDEGHIFEGGLG